jgi:hypothetical protein
MQEKLLARRSATTAQSVKRTEVSLALIICGSSDSMRPRNGSTACTINSMLWTSVRGCGALHP